MLYFNHKFFLLLLCWGLFSYPTAAQQSYEGHRLYLYDLEIKNPSATPLEVSFIPVNTGRYAIALSEPSTDISSLLINYDTANIPSGVNDFETLLKAFLVKHSFQLKLGAIGPKMKIKLAREKLTDKAEKETVSMVHKGDNLETTKTSISSTTEDLLAEKTPTAKRENVFSKDNCVDLLINSILIDKQSKQSVTLRFSITNQGNRSIYLDGRTKKEEDNIAIKAYMASSENLPKGALVLGGQFLNRKKKLKVGESFTSKIKIDISEMTKFTPYIILEVDTYSQVMECDETNNKKAIAIEK